jgi:predicted aspartyl protease
MTDRYPLIGLALSMILVEGRLFGPAVSRDLVLLLDTGSSLTTIQIKLVVELGLQPKLAAKHHLIRTFDGVARLPVVQVPRVRVCGQQVENLSVACAEFSPRLGLDGVLGLNFLQHFDLRISFRDEYIELE